MLKPTMLTPESSNMIFLLGFADDTTRRRNVLASVERCRLGPHSEVLSNDFSRAFPTRLFLGEPFKTTRQFPGKLMLRNSMLPRWRGMLFAIVLCRTIMKHWRSKNVTREIHR